MAVIDELQVLIGADASKAESEVGGFAGFMDKNLGKITAGGAAAGAAMEGFARKMGPLNEANDKLAVRAGVSSEAMRELAIDTANVTFPLEDVQSLMSTAADRGLEGAEALQEYATFWDMVGDATGEAGPELGKQAIALQAVGVEAGNSEEALAAMGFITENTTGSVGDFLTFLDKTGPELNELGADVNDAAAIMGILEKEMGMSARTARQEFKSAVGEADGEMSVMLETLGISEKQFESYGKWVGISGDIIQRNADIHAESYTPMQKLTHQAEELMFKYGGLADVAGAVAMPLMALGPILKGATLAKSGLAKAQTQLNLAMKANPILMIVGLIALLVAGVIWAYKNVEWFRDIVDGAFKIVLAGARVVGDFFAGVFGPAIQWAADVGAGAIRWLADVGGGALSWLGDMVGWVLERFGSIPGWISGAFGGLVDIITWPFRTAFNWIRTAWNNTVGGFGFSVPSWVPFAGGKSFRIPYMASGGDIMRQGMAVVGEAGPELLHLPQGAQVQPLKGGGAGGGKVQIEIVGGDEEMLNLFRKMIRVRGGDVQVVLGT